MRSSRRIAHHTMTILVRPPEEPPLFLHHILYCLRGVAMILNSYI